jgi:hypothetical protein
MHITQIYLMEYVVYRLYQFMQFKGYIYLLHVCVICRY